MFDRGCFWSDDSIMYEISKRCGTSLSELNTLRTCGLMVGGFMIARFNRTKGSSQTIVSRVPPVKSPFDK
jgi:hypothetical protein